MKFETLAVHAGHFVDSVTGAVVPPIHLSTTFKRDVEGVPVGGYTYVRESNPTQTLLEEALAPLEGGEGSLVFASGMAAGVALLQALPPGSHVLFPEDAYYGMRIAAQEFMARAGISSSFVPMDDLDVLRNSFRKETKLVFIESPSNPLMKVVDLAGAIALARESGAISVVDNTFATPALQRPIDLGADVALHSTTKYFGGHSDVQGGALVFRRKDALFETIHHVRHILGGVASPFNSWLVLRGIRTLACRMAVHSANALAIAHRLQAHPRISAVHYPGLPSHPGHPIARRQMSGFGGMLSFRMRAGREAALRVAGRTKIFTWATSLGSVESLIEHRATGEGPNSTAPPELIRLSIGLEHPDDLMDDLEQALKEGER